MSIADKNVEEVKRRVLVKRLINIREVFDPVRISFGSCHSMFRDFLSMKHVSAKLVSKLLYFVQKTRLMSILQELLNDINDNPFFTISSQLATSQG